MPDIRNEDTGTTPEGGLSLEDAGLAISGLLSATAEDERKRKAPATQSDADAADEVDDVEAEGSDDAAHSEQDAEPEDEDERAEPPKPEPRKLKVKLPEGEQELPEDEVVKGYLRTADYTRKTQELAERRKGFEAEETAVKQERQRYATSLAQLEEVLKQSTPTEPDWDTLRAEDPAVFAATYAAWKQHQESIERVTAERQRAEQRVMADRIAEHKAMVQREQEALLAAIPTWSDPEVAKRETKDLLDYATSQGYTADELNAVTDHRVIKILRDAAAYRKAQQKAPEIEKKIERARVMAPGPNASTKREVSDLARANMALAKTHSLTDAGAAITQLLRASEKKGR